MTDDITPPLGTVREITGENGNSADLLPETVSGDADSASQSRSNIFAAGTTSRSQSKQFPVGSGDVHFTPELDRVTAFYAEREPAPIALVGQPGPAKGLLVNYAALRAADTHTTFFAGADPSGARTAWYPIVSALAGILGLTEPTMETLRDALAETGLSAGDLRGLAELFGLASSRGAMPDEVCHREAVRAALNVMRSTTEMEPKAVLCFENIEDYDQPSAAVLAELVATPAGRPPVIVTATTARVVPGAFEVVPIADAGEETTEELSRRLDGLDERSRMLVQAAAAHGTSVAIQALGFFETVEAPSTLDLDRLVVAGFIRHDGTSLSLTSPTLRDLVRSSTPVDVRRRLNDEILSALELDALRVSVCVRAHYAIAAGAPTAFEHALSAARDSLQRFDDVGAVRWFAAAQELTQTAEQNVDAAVGTACAMRRVGELELAKLALQRADGPDGTSSMRALINRERGRNALAESEPEAAAEYFRLAISLGLRAIDPVFLCETYLDLVDALTQTGSDSRWQELSEAVDVVTMGEGYQTNFSIPGLCTIGWRVAEHYFKAGKLSEAEALANEALAYAERIGDEYSVGKLLAVLSDVLSELDRSASAEHHRERSRQIFLGLGDRDSAASLETGE